MANCFLSILRCLFCFDDDPIEAPAPLLTGYQPRAYYNSSRSPSTAGSDHAARNLICRPSNSSTQFNISRATKHISPFHDNLIGLLPNPPSSTVAQPAVTRKLTATDLTTPRSCRAISSSKPPASPSPSPTASKPRTQKQESISFALTNAYLVSSKRPWDSSLNIPPSEPYVTDVEKTIEVDLGKKGQSNSHYSNTSKSSAVSSDAPSSSSRLSSPKSDAKKVMSVDSPKQSTVTNSRYAYKLKNKNISTNKDLNTSKPKVALPIFKVPDGLEPELEDGKVHRILSTSLSQSTYREYFTALMYAEDHYCEKWSDYLLKEVVLEIREESTSDKNKKFNDHVFHSQKNDKKKKFVVFEIDSIPEMRPYLLSRDFVHLKPIHKQIKPFEGIVLRVANRSFVHTEFGNDFHLQHSSTCKYDVSFSFNRVCLKRCHLAIRAITDSTLHNFLFPNQSLKVFDTDQDQEQVSFYNQTLSSKERAAVGHILNLWCPPPYLLVGPPSVPTLSKSHTTSPRDLSTTGRVIREAILQIYRADPGSRILIATPRNKTCDVLMQSLKNYIPTHELFRANAAFRGVEDVLDDILNLTTYNPTTYNPEVECFAMTNLPDLVKFRVISTTFMSSFRLYSEGMEAGHFSHVFLVDASSAIEPEVLVALVNLVDVMTAVVVTGSEGDRPRMIRSDISRKYGLNVSYFERLLKSSLYSSKDPSFLSYL